MNRTFIFLFFYFRTAYLYPDTPNGFDSPKALCRELASQRLNITTLRNRENTLLSELKSTNQKCTELRNSLAICERKYENLEKIHKDLESLNSRKEKEISLIMKEVVFLRQHLVNDIHYY